MNVELPGATAMVVETDNDVETSPLVIVSGLVPKIAVAPDGRPLALSVSVQVVLFPFFVIARVPKTAVSPGATETLVGDPTVTVPGCEARTVPIPATIATRRAAASVAATRRTTRDEELGDDIRNQTSMGTLNRGAHPGRRSVGPPRPSHVTGAWRAHPMWLTRPNERAITPPAKAVGAASRRSAETLARHGLLS